MTYASTVLADTPAAYWRHGAADSTSQATDAAGTKHAVYEQAGTPYTPSHVTGLLTGDSDTAFGPSATGYATVGAWGSNLPATNFSLEAIFTVPDLSATRVLFATAPYAGGWMVVIPTSGIIRIENGGDNDVHASVAISTATTYHLVVTYGAGANSGKIYINGVDRTAADTGCTFTTNANVFVGAYSATPDYPMGAGAVIDESAVYASVLNQTQVTAHYDASVASSSTPTWVSPADTVSMGTTPVLVFTSPTSASAQHFHMQLDTANTFDTGNLRELRTNVDQTGWEFWDGDSWEAFPSGGLSTSYDGNDVRHTVQSALSAATWYRRVRAGV